MYTFKKEPQKQHRDPEHAVNIWHGTLQGSGEAVYNIYTKRATEIVGRQSPLSPFAERHLVWVKYVLADHGDVTIKLVKVSFDDGQGWSVYYDHENEFVGTRTISSKYGCGATYVYATSDQLEEFLAPIYDFHAKAIYHRLCHAIGLLPEIEDELEDILPPAKTRMKF